MAKVLGSDVRILLLTSVGFRVHPKGEILFKELKTKQDFGAFGSWIRHGQSKLANIVYARELARRFPKITSVSVHPGVVKTNLVKNLGMANKFLVYAASGGKMPDPAQGAYNTLWAATAEKSKLKSGQMYEPVGLLSKKLDAVSQGDEFASLLWGWMEKGLEG